MFDSLKEDLEKKQKNERDSSDDDETSSSKGHASKNSDSETTFTTKEELKGMDKKSSEYRSRMKHGDPEYDRWLELVQEEVMAMSDTIYHTDSDVEIDNTFKRIPGVDYEGRNLVPPPIVSIPN